MTEISLLLGPDRHGTVMAVDGDRIVYHGPAADAPRAPSTAQQIACAEGEIQPGIINAHTHIYSGLAPLGIPAARPEPKNFVQILERLWWRLDRALDEDSLRASARLYVAESLLAGTTTLIDHHESPDFIDGSLDLLADTCVELGMRAVLTYGATERNGGRKEADRGLAECRRFCHENRRPLIRGLVGLHASFTVSDDTVRRAGNLCRDLDTVLHTHMAEDLADVVAARKQGWEGPLERLLELRGLPPGSIMAHGVHLERRQVVTADAKGVWLVQNPRSNRGNGVGYPRALSLSDRVAIGTDGYPSRLDEEAEALRSEAAAHGDDAAALERRLAAGHRLASELFEKPFAPLAVGCVADAVVMMDGGPVHVVTGGRLVVEDGELTCGDIEAIRSAAADEAPRLWERMEALPRES